MRLYLIRHGETEYNRTGRVQGHGEVPLNDTGIDQIARVSQRVAGMVSLDRIYASDLRRTAMSAAILAAHTRAPVVFDPLFRERDPGDLTGKRFDEAQLFFTDLAYEPPNGESVPVFLGRVGKSIERLLEDEADADRHIALVTHGMYCRAFLHHCFEDAAADPASWPNASLTIADYSPGIGWSLDIVACDRHLGTPDGATHSPGA